MAMDAQHQLREDIHKSVDVKALKHYEEELFSRFNCQDILNLCRETSRSTLIPSNVCRIMTSLDDSIPIQLMYNYLNIYIYRALVQNGNLFQNYLRMLSTYADCHSVVHQIMRYHNHITCGLVRKKSTDSDHHFTTEDDAIILAEVLAGYSNKWKEIATALGLSQNTITNMVSMLHIYSAEICLKKVLVEWIFDKSFKRPPTMDVLKKALSSKIVGLGAEASSLLEDFMHQQKQYWQLTYRQPTFESTDSVQPDRFEIIYQSQDTCVDEGNHVLLGVLVRADPNVDIVEYRWEKSDSRPLTDSNERILCILAKNITCEGVYRCTCICYALQQGSQYRHHKTFTINLNLTVKTPVCQYRTILVKKYCSQPEVPANTWPPVRSSTFINLALIKHQESIHHARSFGRYTIQGDADDILSNKESIKYDKLFSNIGSGSLILVEGRPGSGKTTLVHKISQDWASEKTLFKNIKLLFLADLRGFSSNPNIALHDIVGRYFSDPAAVDDIVKYANKHGGLGLCFILDSLDEYLPQNAANCYIFELIRREVLPESIVIVASRPFASSKFRSRATRQVEVLGFLREHISEYIGDYNFSEKSKHLDLLKYLDQHPNVHHMCYLPIHTAMVCFVFDHLEGELPQTETKVYEAFTKFTLLRTLYRHEEDVRIESILKLPMQHHETYFQICKLAFEMTLSSKQVMNQTEAENFGIGVDGLGLITIDKMAMTCGFQKLYTFLHLTFQEFLAACFVACLEEDKQTQLLKMHGNKSQLQVVWKFYCGLVKFEGHLASIDSILANIHHGIMYNVHCAFESQDPSFCESIIKKDTISFKGIILTLSDYAAIAYVLSNLKQPINKLVFDKCILTEEGINTIITRAGSNLSQITTMCYHGDNGQLSIIKQLISALPLLKILDITNVDLGRDEITLMKDFCHPYLQIIKLGSANNPLYSSVNLAIELGEALVAQCSSLINICFSFGKFSWRSADMHPLPFYFYYNSPNVNLSFSKLKLIESQVLSDSFQFASCPTTTLNLMDCGIDDLKAMCLAEGLEHLKHLENLDLSFNGIGDSGAVALSKSISHHLQTLDLSFNKISHEGVSSLIKTLQHYSTLRVFMINNNAQDIATAGRHGNRLKFHTLNISNKNFGRNGVDALSACMKKSQVSFVTSCGITHNVYSNIYSLDISCNLIGDSGILALANVLKRCDNLRCLNISGNSIEYAGVVALTKINCSSLNVLDISSNSLKHSGASVFASVLKRCTNLRKLNIANNHIESSGAVTLAKGLKYSYNLRVLNVSSNGIDGVGAMALTNALKYCGNLKEFDISGNKIGSSGAKALAYALKSCSNLHLLDVSRNKIGCSGAVAFANALKFCPNLSAFVVSDNNIENDGAIAVADALKFTSNLSSFNIRGNNIDNLGAVALANALKCCSSLSSLDVSRNKIGYSGALAFADVLKFCTNISAFDISDSNIGNDDAVAIFNALKRSNSLSSLDVSSNFIKWSGTEALADILFRHAPNLCILRIGNNRFGHKACKALAFVLKYCRNLQELDISQGNVEDQGMMMFSSGLKWCVNLRKLNVSRNAIGKDGILALADALRYCTHLYHLNIGHNNITYNGILALAKTLKHCTNLYSIDISNSNLKCSGALILCEALKHCIKLRELNISNNYIGHDGAMAISNVLQHYSDFLKLNISYSNVGTLDLGEVFLPFNLQELNATGMGHKKPLALFNSWKYSDNLHSLLKLNIGGSFIGDSDAKDLGAALRFCTNLQSLDISFTKLGPNIRYVADGLKYCARLSQLKVSNNCFKEDDIAAFAGGLKFCKHLCALYMSRCIASSSSILDLTGALEHCTNLCDLHISGNFIKCDGAIALAKSLKNHKNLYSLDISSNDIGSTGIEALAVVLRQNTSISRLNIGRNNIKHSGMISFAGVLASCKNLHSLDVHYNNVGPEGTVVLAGALKNCTYLQELYISSNHIETAGAIALANSLTLCTGLHTLDISDNNIKSEGAIALANTLKHRSYSLRKLIIDSNDIKSSGAVALASALKFCTNLSQLDVGYNNIGQDGADALANALKNHLHLYALDFKDYSGVTAARNLS